MQVGEFRREFVRERAIEDQVESLVRELPQGISLFGRILVRDEGRPERDPILQGQRCQKSPHVEVDTIADQENLELLATARLHDLLDLAQERFQHHRCLAVRPPAEMAAQHPDVPLRHPAPVRIVLLWRQRGIMQLLELLTDIEILISFVPGRKVAD